MWSGAAIAQTGGQAYLVRGENGNDQKVEIIVSTAAVDGTLGAPATLLSASDWGYGVLGTAARDDRLGVILYQPSGDWSEMAFLLAAPDGTVVSGPTALPGGQPNAAAVVATEGGFAVLHLSSPPQPALTLHRFGPDGQPAGEPVQVAKAVIVGAPAMVATASGGVAVAWPEAAADVPDSPRSIRFRAFDASGGPAGEVRTLSPASTGQPDHPALLARTGGFVAAWDERWTNGSVALDAEGWEVVRLAVLGADGAVAGPVFRVQAPETDRARSQPFLVALDGDAPDDGDTPDDGGAPGGGAPGGDFGLGFRDETMIYVCAGCVSDAVIRFLPLHGDDLAPAGDEVTLAISGGGVGGLGGLSAVRLGSDFLAYVRIEVHALFTPALVAWRCE